MAKTHRVLITTVALAAVGYGIFAPQDKPGPAAAPSLAMDNWDIGETRSYALDFETREQALLGAPTDASGLSADARFVGSIAVTYRGPHHGNRVFGWRIDDVDSFSAGLGEQQMTIPGPAVTGFELLVETDARGAVQAVHVDEAAPEVARNLLRTVATEAQLIRSEQAQWVSTERAAHGKANTQFEREGNVVEKIRDQYTTLSPLAWLTDLTTLEQDVDSEFDFVLDGAGRVERVEGSEELRVVDDSGELVLASDLRLAMAFEKATYADPRSRQDVAKVLAARRTYDAERAIASEEAEHNALLAQANGMTPGELMDFIASHRGHVKDDPSFSRKLWQATGLLQLRPELCAEVAASFARPDRTQTQRFLALDLLASTGHAAAQQSMIDALSSETARSDREAYARYLQRTAFVDEPTEALTAFVADKLESPADDHERLASAYTLATLSRRTREAGNASVADSAMHRIVNELSAADDPEEQSHLLRALSNTSSPRNVEVAASYADAETWTVRAAAAESLHGVTTDDARELLTEMLDDSSALVQGVALRKLAAFPRGSFDVAGVRDNVVEGRIAAPAFHHLVAYAQNAPASEARAEILRYVMEHTNDNLDLRARAADALRKGASWTDTTPSSATGSTPR